MSAEVINIHDELAEAKVAPFHRRLAILMTCVTMFDGYDTNNPAYVIHYVAKPWHLSKSHAGMLVSSGLVGFLFGSALHGMVADRVGRRVTMLGALLIAAIFSVSTPWIGTSFWSYCCIRLITGVGLGVLMPLATTYINEFAPRRLANVFPIWCVALGWALGGVIASLVGIYLTPRFGWQSLYYVDSLAFILLIALYIGLPESLKFLAIAGKVDQIKSLLTRLRPERAAIYATGTIQFDPPRATGNSVAKLLAPQYRRLSLSIWAAAFLSLFCVYGLSGWIPTAMIQRGEGFATSFAFGGLIQIGSFFGALLGGYLIDRSGSSRGWISALWVLGGLSVLLLLFFNNHALNIFVVAAAGFGIPGAQFLLNNYTAQSYNTSVRASAVGMELGVGRVGAFLGPYIAGLLQQIYGGPQVMFFSISLAAFGAGLIIWFLGRPAVSIANADLIPLSEIGEPL